MIFYLRDDNNKSIVDVECYVTEGHVELHSTVIIEYFVPFLLSNLSMEEEITEDFDNISKLRGWLWETHFMGRKNTSDEYDTIIKILVDYFDKIAKIYNLRYVTD
jgi:hypothetical protein